MSVDQAGPTIWGDHLLAVVAEAKDLVAARPVALIGSAARSKEVAHECR